MQKEDVQNKEKEEVKDVNEEAVEYYEAESWQFSSCGD